MGYTPNTCLAGGLDRWPLGDAPRRLGPACAADLRFPGPRAGHSVSVVTLWWVGLLLAAWTVLPFPLAVLVGRSLRAAGAPLDAVALAGEGHPVRSPRLA
jgi:hypothetical protein